MTYDELRRERDPGRYRPANYFYSPGFQERKKARAATLAGQVLWNAAERAEQRDYLMTTKRAEKIKRLSKSISQPNRNEHLDETQGLCTQKETETVAPTERGKNH